MPPFWTIGCLSGASSVLLGAFGAHGLKKRISDPSRIGQPPPPPKSSLTFPPKPKLTLTLVSRIANWNTAAHYQLIHSAVLTFASVATPHNTVAMGLFTVGMGLFSGSLYALVLDPERFGKFAGPVTPVGGLALVGGWVALAVLKRPVGVRFG